MAIEEQEDWIDDSLLTTAELVADIRRRMLFGKQIVGTDTRALPPVSRAWILQKREYESKNEYQQ